MPHGSVTSSVSARRRIIEPIWTSAGKSSSPSGIRSRFCDLAYILTDDGGDVAFNTYASPANAGLEICSILRSRVSVASCPEITSRMIDWAKTGKSRIICAANVHVVMEAYDQPAYRAAVDMADIVTTDGMPLVWTAKLLGFRSTRVYGPDLMLSSLAAAAAEGVPVGFFGGTPEVVETLCTAVTRRYPRIHIAYRYSPPFLPSFHEADYSVIEAINASRCRILFVGLGCPKQEQWMALHKGHVKTVMLGAGAAFDFIAGTKPQAPRWMMAAGLEWLFRLATEPRRLWRRYLKHNPRFLVLVARQVAGGLKHLP